MKKMTYQTITLAILFNSPLLLASGNGGHDSGNGEFLHACRAGKKDNEYKVLEIWDFYEAKKADSKNYEVARDWSKTVYEQANEAIEKIELIDSAYGKLVRNELEFMIQPSLGVSYMDVKGVDLLEDMDRDVFSNGWLQMVDGPLTPTNDTNSYIYTDKGQNCEKLQLVNYPEYLDPNEDPSILGLDKKIKIDRKLWRLTKNGIFSKGYLLHKTDKAAALIHEAVYKVERDYFNADDSSHTRRVVATLFQKGNTNTIIEKLRGFLTPSNNTLFSEYNFHYENARKYFQFKGKFVPFKERELEGTQWDLFGQITRDGRNSIDPHYTPEKSNQPFAQGRRPRIHIQENGLVFAENIFQDEVCGSEKEVIDSVGCLGRTYLSPNGFLDLGAFPENSSINPQYIFPGVRCKLTFSRKVIMCESLAKTGETFYTLFYKQDSYSKIEALSGTYRFSAERVNLSRIGAVIREHQDVGIPHINLSGDTSYMIHASTLLRGVGAMTPINEEYYSHVVGWEELLQSYNVLDSKISLALNLNRADRLDCRASSMGDILFCNFTRGVGDLAVPLVFSRIK